MRFQVILSFSFLTTVFAESSADLSSLLAQWSEVAPKVTTTFDMPTVIPTRLGNVDPPPTSLMLAIFTGVPGDVLKDLMDTEGRASIKSEFEAGNTPSWYVALPSPVKSYIESINKALKTGGNDYTGTEKAPGIPDFTATPGAIATDDASPDDGNEGGAQATSSKGGAMPQQTWGAMEMLGFSGAVGILGAAIAL